MRYLTILGLLGMGLIAAPYAHAQRVTVGIGFGPAYVGPPPACVYGYYDYSPYACAPYGYYGPDWFSSGVFIGAGPWFHGYYGRPGFYDRHEFHGRPFRGRDFDDRWRGFEGRRDGGEFHGRDFRGRDFHGDGFRGGDFHGQSFRGGESRGGREFHGRDFHGGGFHGGESHGGGGSHGGGRR